MLAALTGSYYRLSRHADASGISYVKLSPGYASFTP